MEIRRSCCSRHGRASLVHAREQLAIVNRSLLMLSLNRQGSLVLLMLRGQLLRGRTRRNAAVTPVVADMVHGGVVHDDCLVVDVRNVGNVHVGHAAVVIEVASAPLATVETFTGISEAVVNAAVEADVRAPVAAVEKVEAFVPSPPSRSPEHSYGSDHPGAWHPVIAVIVVPRPIAGRPEIAGSGTDGLGVNRQGGRSDSYRDSHSDLRE
jgi:hypothetical protein